MNWITEYEAIMAEADAVTQETKIKFPRGCRCIGGMRGHRRADELYTKAWRLLGKQMFGPPRHMTKRFEMFLTNQ